VPKDIVSKAQRSRMMRAVKRARTEAEQPVAALLRRLDVRFRRNDARLPGSPDFVLPQHCVAIFVHGCFWHGHVRCTITKGGSAARIPARNAKFWATKLDANRRRDRRKADRVRARGYRVLTIWACALRDPERLSRRVAAFLTA
jgi:DNA mismatch endonuclease, patch repair protein